MTTTTLHFDPAKLTEDHKDKMLDLLVAFKRAHGPSSEHLNNLYAVYGGTFRTSILEAIEGPEADMLFEIYSDMKASNQHKSVRDNGPIF